MAIPVQVTFDCADPAGVASFWAEALGYKLRDPPEGYASWPDFLTAIGVPDKDWNKASAIVGSGGYAGYFHDPDQHLWEVVWNPEWSPAE